MTCHATNMHLSPVGQSVQLNADTNEYLPAQHRHSSVDRHEAVHAAVLRQLPSVAKRDARMLQHEPSLWSITRGHHLISGLFRGGVSSAVMCPSRGPPSGCASPLGAYSSPAGHRIPPHNLTNPLYLPLSTCLRKRVSYHIHLSPAPQVTHADAP